MTPAPRKRQLNVLQKITLGYWSLVLPMAVAGALIIVTVALVQTRYVQKENLSTDTVAAAQDVRVELARQEGRLRALSTDLVPSHAIAKERQIRAAQDALAALVARLNDLVARHGDLTTYAAFTEAWSRFDRAVRPPATIQRYDEYGPGHATAAATAAIAAAAIAAVTGLGDETDAAYRQTDAAMWRFVYATTGVALVIIVLGAIAGFVLALRLPRSVARHLGRVISALGTAAAQMHGVVSQVATTSVETASSISEAATTVDEVRQTSLQASQKATQLADESQRAEEVAEAGRRAVAETLAGMQHIEHQMAVVSESIVRMNERSQSVAAIMNTISGLAEQSQLLSVNAALEASNAGDYGKGFGVVAEEIKNLAAGSKASVVQVRGIMNDVQTATAAAVMAAEQSSRAIDGGARQAQESSVAIEALAESVTDAAQSATQILSSAQQQLVGMDQLGEAMASINEASSHNASGAKDLESSVRQVEEMAEDLQQMVAVSNPLSAMRRRRATSTSRTRRR